MLAASVAYGADAGTAPKFSGEFRSELANTLNKTVDAKNKTATTEFEVTDAILRFDGKLNTNGTYMFSLNLNGDSNAEKNGQVQVAKINYMLNSMLSLTLGKDRVNQGGYSSADIGNYDAIWGKAAWLAGVHPEFANTAAFHVNTGAAGTFTIQLVNDVVSDKDNAQRWNNARKQPAFNLQYEGSFGPVKPLLQINQYDMNHSRAITVGARAGFGMANVTFDYTTDSRSFKVTEGTSDKDKFQTLNSMTLRADVTAGTFKPFFYYSNFVRSGEKDTVATEDTKTNTAGTFDDNGTHMALGTSMHGFGDNWAPYVAYRSTAGDFAKADDAAAKESRATTSLVVGAMANF